MNYYHFFFFHIYSSYYKDGQYSNDIPWLTASVLLSASVLSFIFGVSVLIGFLYNQELPELPDKNKSVLMATGVCLIQVAYFRWDNRYKRIFQKYRNGPFDRNLYRILAWSFTVGGFLVIPGLALFRLWLDGQPVITTS